MEYFDYADWLADGRRAAKAKGKPDLDTERMFLQTGGKFIHVVYTVELQTVSFEMVVASIRVANFSTRFFNMLAMEE